MLDSIERLIRKNKFQPSGIFNFEPGGTAFSRVEGLAGANGMVARGIFRLADRLPAGADL